MRPGLCMLPDMTRRPLPISLRVQNAERDMQRRRMKWQATKAIVTVDAMIELMSPAERVVWRKECRMVQSLLQKIKNREM